MKSSYQEPERGGRGMFVRINITTPPTLKLKMEEIRFQIKLAGKKDISVSHLVNLAISEFIDKWERKDKK